MDQQYDLESLASLGAKMRHAQKEFFRTRSDSALQRSKHLERQFDDALSAIQSKQKTLFE